MLRSAAFQQIQECGDIISSILIVVKFIQENNIAVGFELSKLRQITLRSVDSETNTYLWHINAVIAASSDFEHLLLGIEMMFDRFLGNRACFMKERGKPSPSAVSNQMVTPSKTHKFLGNEVVSFVNSYYDDRADANSAKKDCTATELKVVTEDVAETSSATNGNDENRNSQNSNGNQLKVEENEEFMVKYRGKISSPISFRMRQQKRMMQSERRGSQANSKNVSLLDFEDSGLDIHAMGGSFVQPEVSSPFSVSKFAKTVDFGHGDDDEMIGH